MRPRLWLAAGAVLLVAGVRSGSADNAISMRVSPKQAFAPVNLRVSVTIEPSADNRSVIIVADSDQFYRSSQIPLEGELAPRTINVEFKGIPGGEYEVSGTLVNSRGRQRAVTRQFARVLSIIDELQ